jgi:DNA-binding NarL/FixJ family response regulator
MPRMDGEEAFCLMREIKPDLRIIVMSGFDEQDTTQRFVGRGLAGFMSKPFTAEILLNKIDTVLRAPIVGESRI